MMTKANQFAAGISGSETLILMIRASDSPNSIALVACAYAKFFALTRHAVKCFDERTLRRDQHRTSIFRPVRRIVIFARTYSLDERAHARDGADCDAKYRSGASERLFADDGTAP